MSADRAVALETLIEVVYPSGQGGVGLRGTAPLSWDETTPPDATQGDASLFRLQVPEGELIEFKLARGDDWDGGQNYMVHAGDHLHVEPAFAQRTARLDEGLEIGEGDEAVTVDVLLPPGYDEHSTRRYVVVYALDGQSLWSHSKDPFGVWSLEVTLTELSQLAAVEELILVGIHTSVGRIGLLSPVPDAEYGGGGGEAFLHRLVNVVKPFVDARYRTQPGRDSTGILGSSMGGLFAFYAAWTRSDVFGRAACLSSSFWWAQRWAVRLVQGSKVPEPRPMLYLDSGAALDQFDTRHRDGYHHTRSMLRALTKAGLQNGSEVHRLVFPGQVHHAASWASRVALPLQLLFPRTPKPFDAERWGKGVPPSAEAPVP